MPDLIVRALLTLWGALFALAWSTFIGVAYIVLRPFERSGEWFDRLFALQCRVLVPALGIKLVIEDANRFPADQPVLLMSNHRSYLDIVALVAAFPGHSLRFVAKRSLGQIPIFGWAIALSPCVLIDRGDARGSLRRIRAGASKLPAGAALVIFPEGTRSSEPNMLPFKKGAFLLAAGSGLPILPVTLSGSGRIWGKGQTLFRPGTITVRVRPLLTVNAGEKRSPDQLSTQVRQEIEVALVEVTP